MSYICQRSAISTSQQNGPSNSNMKLFNHSLCNNVQSPKSCFFSSLKLQFLIILHKHPQLASINPKESQRPKSEDLTFSCTQKACQSYFWCQFLPLNVMLASGSLCLSPFSTFLRLVALCSKHLNMLP